MEMIASGISMARSTPKIVCFGGADGAEAGPMVEEDVFQLLLLVILQLLRVVTVSFVVIPNNNEIVGANKPHRPNQAATSIHHSAQKARVVPFLFHAGKDPITYYVPITPSHETLYTVKQT